MQAGSEGNLYFSLTLSHYKVQIGVSMTKQFRPLFIMKLKQFRPKLLFLL